MDILHLAIPCRDLDEAARFYETTLGCRIGRRYDDRVSVDFFGLQLVCHLSPEAIASQPTLYPRHFGVAVADPACFDALASRLEEAGALLEPPLERFVGRAEEHRALFLADPSNNVIEFKCYRDPDTVY